MYMIALFHVERKFGPIKPRLTWSLSNIELSVPSCGNVAFYGQPKKRTIKGYGSAAKPVPSQESGPS